MSLKKRKGILNRSRAEEKPESLGALFLITAKLWLRHPCSAASPSLAGPAVQTLSAVNVGTDPEALRPIQY